MKWRQRFHLRETEFLDASLFLVVDTLPSFDPQQLVRIPKRHSNIKDRRQLKVEMFEPQPRIF